MMRSRIAAVSAAGVLLALSSLALAADRQPNVIVIVADDQGYADLGVHGSKDIPTPHIDSLAKNGIRCTSGYVSGPYCSPTRAGLLTGRYQTRFGHEFNPGPPNDANKHIGLSLKETTLAQRMKAAGYATGMVGKWHLGHAPEFHPLSRGFDSYYGFLGGAHAYLPGQNGNEPIYRGREPTDDPEYLTDAFGREAVAFVDQHKDHPFFLYLTFNAVHTPMHAIAKYLDRFPNIEGGKRKTYAAMTSAMDDNVGALLETLRNAKLEEHTLIFYVSDNGGPIGVNGSINTPLNGAKATTWEGGIRVPYFVQWKGTLPAGKTYDQPVIQLDILPTALAAAGAPVADKLDGVNLLPFLKGDRADAPHAALYWRFGEQRAIRMGQWKLTQARGMTHWELFDLASDIGEAKNLAEAKPDKLKELSAAWDEWNKELIPATWGQQRANNAKKAAKKKATN